MLENYTFPRECRVLQPKEYRFINQKAKKFFWRPFIFLVYHHEKPNGRLGMILTKKSIKTAVARNRVRRQIRESFRYHQSMLAGMDIVVIARSETQRLSNAQLQEGLYSSWKMLNKKVLQKPLVGKQDLPLKKAC